MVSLSAMGPAGAKAATGIRAVASAAGPLAAGFAVLGLAGGVLVNSYIDQKQAVDDYASSLDALSGAVTQATRDVAAKGLQDQGAIEAARDLGIETALVTDAVLGDAAARDKVTAAIARATDASRLSENATGEQRAAWFEARRAALTLEEAVNSQTGTLAESVTQVRDHAEAARESGGAMSKAGIEHAEAAAQIEGTGLAAGNTAGEIAGMTEETISAEDALANLSAALDALLGAELGVQEATDATEQAIADLAARAEDADGAVEVLSGGITDNTQAARDNRAAINDAMDAIAAEAEARAASGEGIGKITDRIYASREALIQEAMSRGASREEAEAYTDVLLAIPATVTSNITTPGMQRAIEDAEYLKRALDNMPKSVSVSLTTYATTIRQDIAAANRGGTQPRSTAQADGGFWQVTPAASGLMRESMMMRGGQYGAGITWAEPEVGWEAYISGKPGREARNKGILSEAASRFGLAVVPNYGRQAQGPYAATTASSSGAAPSPQITVNADSAVLRTYGASIARQALREADVQLAARMSAVS